MTNTKNTKHALLTSVMAMLLCCSMLVGTTFAWFTDSVASSSNTITAGNLDIEVQYTLDGENWKELDGATDLFQKGLWEPGHTEVVALRIKNNGSLALKYAANMNIVNETKGKTKDGADIVLSDILTVTTVTHQVNQVGDILLGMVFGGSQNTDTGAAKTFKSGNILASDQELLAGDAHYVIITVDMAETVGNEANHNGTNIPSIDFGINVLASQLTYENDSFGNQYDKDATYPGDFVGGKGTAEDPYLINEASQLMSISDYSEYTYFKVADGVETLDMTGVGKINLNGSFDGNGVTMNNLTTALFEYVGKVGDAKDIKISNFTANVNTTDGRALVRNVINPGTTTFENVALHGYIEGQYNMGSFYNYGTANASGTDGADYTVNFVNATSDVTLVCTSGNIMGGMLGHGFEGADYKLSINMDANSKYTGKMYTTTGANCYQVMAMCSHATYILNGEEVSRYTNTYPSTKLAVAAPVAQADGYYVAPVSGADHYVVSLESQLTAYDENNVKIPNQAGLTWSLGKKTITEGLDGKVFDLVNSAEIVNDKNIEIGYELNDGVLKVYTGRDWNFASGWITLNVTQYDAEGTILATGNVRVHTFAEP